jgi:hypothetical protein
VSLDDSVAPEARPDSDLEGKHSGGEETRDVLIEQWVRSPENLRTQPIFFLLATGGLMAAYGGIALTFTSRNSTAATVGGIALAVAGLVAGAIGFLRRSAARADFFERQERAAKVDVDQAIEQLGDETDLRGLLRLNRSQMAAYEALTRRQAASSYRLSHVALAVGLILIAGGAAAALFADGGATKAATAGLAAIAGTMSGFIARTYLRIYERTLLQLNYYFEQPLVSSYVLTAERLVAKMSETRRDEALDRIVHRLLYRLNTSFEAATKKPTPEPPDSQT